MVLLLTFHPLHSLSSGHTFYLFFYSAATENLKILIDASAICRHCSFGVYLGMDKYTLSPYFFEGGCFRRSPDSDFQQIYSINRVVHSDLKENVENMKNFKCFFCESLRIL